jgi:calcium/calmodulin-dependent protein kinase I
MSTVGAHNEANTSSDFAIDADSEYMVSRNHCELYTVVYEPGVTHVYVRDRKSFNGTYVNDMLVGIGPELSPGYLLQDGDVIEIKPYWKFTFHEVRNPTRHLLTDMQAVESKVGGV